LIQRECHSGTKRRAAERPEGKIDDYTAYKNFYNLFERGSPTSITDDNADATTIAQRVHDGMKSKLFDVQTRE